MVTSDSPGRHSFPAKLPRLVLEGVFSFPPHRETLGGTAYLIVGKAGNVLVDCPAWEGGIEAFLRQQGGVRWLFLTHRGGMGKSIPLMQTALGCEVLIQEQEAYLLPEVPVTAWGGDFCLSPELEAIWTPGHSPGSSCLYWSANGGTLFSGRHLLPDRTGKLLPLREAKTFHWRRQLDSVAKLRQRFTPQTLSYLCPGANTGFLRGRGAIEGAYQHLSAL